MRPCKSKKKRRWVLRFWFLDKPSASFYVNTIEALEMRIKYEPFEKIKAAVLYRRKDSARKEVCINTSNKQEFLSKLSALSESE
jgi:hypothetical protein